MTRKKIKLAFISNDYSRKATFKKRKKGLMKKVSELSTLCGIDACAILYNPFDNASEPDVWPNMQGVHRILAQFKKMPEMEQYKKMLNQESFIRQRIAKATDDLKKVHKENREKEITLLMYQCLTGRRYDDLSVADLNELSWVVDRKLEEINRRLESLKKVEVAAAPPPPPPTPPPPPPPAAAAAEESRGMIDIMRMDGMQRPQMFMELLNTPIGQVEFGNVSEEFMMPYGGNNYNNYTWPRDYFP